ncbi:MAG: CsbD family protein [Cyanobacteria bacterium P01_A01_bin.40]
MSIQDVKNTAEELKLKAEARSEDIEGTIRENLGEFSNDPEAVQAGQAKQAKAEALREEAESK